MATVIFKTRQSDWTERGFLVFSFFLFFLKHCFGFYYHVILVVDKILSKLFGKCILFIQYTISNQGMKSKNREDEMENKT